MSERTYATRPCSCMRYDDDHYCPLCKDTGRIEATPEESEMRERLYKECYVGHMTDEWWWKLTDWVLAYGRKQGWNEATKAFRLGGMA